jgi:hypothetical protein
VNECVRDARRMEQIKEYFWPQKKKTAVSTDFRLQSSE